MFSRAARGRVPAEAALSDAGEPDISGFPRSPSAGMGQLTDGLLQPVVTKHIDCDPPLAPLFAHSLFCNLYLLYPFGQSSSVQYTV